MTATRQPVVVAELQLDTCTLTYGTWPCTAGFRDFHTAKCYNTFATCQDPDNYARGTKSLWLVGVDGQCPFAFSPPCLPLIQAVRRTPARLNPTASHPHLRPLGRRAEVRLRCVDTRHNDHGRDPYQAERYSGAAQRDGVGYDPYQRGTFWTKFRARERFWLHRPLILREGYADQAFNEFTVRSYVLDRIEGPDLEGRLTIIAKDPLKLTEDEHALAPRPSKLQLAQDLTADATTVLLTPAGELQRTQADAYDDPAVRYYRIGRELLRADAHDFADDEMTVVRGQRTTEAREHKAGSVVQPVLQYSGVRVEDVLRDLLVRFGDLDEGFIDLAEWRAELQRWLPDHSLSALITTPTGVESLVAELCRTGFYLWWDERAAELRVRALRPAAGGDLPLLTDDNAIVEGRLTEQPEQRTSQVLYYYDIDNPVGSTRDDDNYNRLHVVADLDGERAQEYGESQLLTLHSRWLTDVHLGLTLSHASGLLAHGRHIPAELELSIAAQWRDRVRLGDVVQVRSALATDAHGEPRTISWFVVALDEPHPLGTVLRLRLQQADFADGLPEQYAFIMSNDAARYHLDQPPGVVGRAWLAYTTVWWAVHLADAEPRAPWLGRGATGTGFGDPPNLII